MWEVWFDDQIVCFTIEHLSIINKIIEGCSMLNQTIWPSNHTSHTKLYLNQFVASVLRDNIGIVIFDLWGHEGCRRPKTTLGGQKWHEGVDLLKKVFNKSFSTTSISNQIWAMTSDKKDTATSEVTVAVAAARSNITICIQIATYVRCMLLLLLCCFKQLSLALW